MEIEPKLPRFIPNKRSLLKALPLALGLSVGGIAVAVYATNPYYREAPNTAVHRPVTNTSDAETLQINTKSPQEIILSQRLESAKEYLLSTGNQDLAFFLQKIVEQELMPEETKSFEIVPNPPSGIVWTLNDPKPVDLFFKPIPSLLPGKIDKVITYLVIDPEYLSKNQLTNEELAIMIVQEMRVVNALEINIKALEGHPFEFLDFQGQLVARDNLEVLYTYDLATRILPRLINQGKITSPRLMALASVAQSPRFYNSTPEVWFEFAKNLPPEVLSILPGLSGR